MSRWLELLEDDDKQLSCYRFCFIGGCLALFGLAIAQFFSIGSIPIALYGILATMASGGYLGGKYVDMKCQEPTIKADATDGDPEAP